MNVKSASDQTALQAIGLSNELGDGALRRTVLRDIDLSVRAGRWTCIVGPNGAGKSTLLQALAGMLPVRGQVCLFGRALSAWGQRERARALAWLAQSSAADSGAHGLLSYDVALLGRLPHRGWLAPPTAADHAATEHALRRTGAWAWRDRPLGLLSGGERQRVLLARLLAVDATVMLMDEPLAHLDPPHQGQWIALVRELVAQGRTVVSVLHEVPVALMADDLVVLQAGQLRYAGACDDSDAHRALNDVFDDCLDIVRIGERWVALPRGLHGTGAIA